MGTTPLDETLLEYVTYHWHEAAKKGMDFASFVDGGVQPSNVARLTHPFMKVLDGREPPVGWRSL